MEVWGNLVGDPWISPGFLIGAATKYFLALICIYMYIYIYRLEWTRALNARSKLATGEVAAAFVGPKRPFVSLWNRLG